MASDLIIEPGSDWVALHQAPFRFFPAFAHSAEDVRRELMLRMKRVQERLQLNFRCYEGEDYTVICEGGELLFEIDADYGSFDLTSKTYDGLPIVFGCPLDFLSRYDQPELRSYAAVERDGFRAIAQALSDVGAAHLTTALKTRKARIMARVGRLVSPFEHIPLDVWSGFQTALRDPDCDHQDREWDAVGSDGTRLFSIFVAADRSSCGSSSFSSSSAETDCFKWLEGLMAESEYPSDTRDGLRALALSSYKGLSGAGFDRSWRKAIEQTGASKWKAPGRRPKSKTQILDPINR